ncbi:hypothetical protein P154DRAFT_520564 [Amniculicola lignicola CBS 123094]|uniref:Uncharacterized protein n=1 Tax=Amniculicola lignicola CBS 123094 TaxID=1392246 RepID=A0A6A5WZ01_9PLEO|nr:hypothetical protein P154DRAFT_520564 [Amniculicola lignicola CBS 123094]
MSAGALPITAARFAAALESLPLSALHSKAAEIQNSNDHLRRSNKELEAEVRKSSDKDCYEAMLENEEVIKRNEERIALLKREVTEVRGLPWAPQEGGKVEEVRELATVGDGSAAPPAQNQSTRPVTNGQAGEQRNGNAAADEEEGVFL